MRPIDYSRMSPRERMLYGLSGFGMSSTGVVERNSQGAVVSAAQSPSDVMALTSSLRMAQHLQGALDLGAVLPTARSRVLTTSVKKPATKTRGATATATVSTRPTLLAPSAKVAPSASGDQTASTINTLNRIRSSVATGGAQQTFVKTSLVMPGVTPVAPAQPAPAPGGTTTVTTGGSGGTPNPTGTTGGSGGTSPATNTGTTGGGAPYLPGPAPYDQGVPAVPADSGGGDSGGGGGGGGGGGSGGGDDSSATDASADTAGDTSAMAHASSTGAATAAAKPIPWGKVAAGVGVAGLLYYFWMKK